MDSRPTLRRDGRRLWRVDLRFFIARTHTPIVERLWLELVLESADYSSESAVSNADPPKIGVWVRAFRHMNCIRCMNMNMQKTTNKSIKPSAIAPTYQTAKTSKVKVAGLICIYSLVSNNFDCFYTEKCCTPRTSDGFACSRGGWVVFI